MKTRLFLTAMIMVIATLAVRAEVEVKEIETEKSKVGIFLQSAINHPGSTNTQNMEGSMRIVIILDENQNLVYNILENDNALLKLHVERNIKRMESRLVKMMQPNTPQHFKLSFVTK